MNNITRTEISAALAAVAGVLSALLGGWDRAAYVLTLFIIIDYITGCAAAVRGKRMSSSAGFVGLLKKATIFLVVIVAVQLDGIAGTNQFIRTSTISFFICNEGISILENASEIGVPLPRILKDTLIKLREKQGGDDDDTEATK